MVIFINFSPTLNHLHPLQVENCDSNSPLVMDEDDNGKLRLVRVKFLYFLFQTCMSKIRDTGISSLYLAFKIGKCAAQKVKNFCSSSLWTCLHHMAILKVWSTVKIRWTWGSQNATVAPGHSTMT